MNKILKKLGILIVLATLMASCKDYDSLYTDVQLAGETEFNGTILDYLEQDGSQFDSMMVVINGIPGLRDSLQHTSASLTVFAIPNSCFREAISRLNNYRQAKQKGTDIYLRDLMIEPFTVIEKLPGATPTDDSIIIEHPYDYRLQLDSLVSRYVFRGALNSEFLTAYADGMHNQDFQFNYRMHIQFEQQNASGIEGMGRRRLILSDENNTQLAANWDRSESQTIDIKTKNGYIHILNPGHEFGFSKLISQFQNYGNEYIYE
jgi:hypothetical protein